MYPDEVLVDKHLALERWRDSINELKALTTGSREWEALNKRQRLLAALCDGNINQALKELANCQEFDEREIFDIAPALLNNKALINKPH